MIKVKILRKNKQVYFFNILRTTHDKKISREATREKCIA